MRLFCSDDVRHAAGEIPVEVYRQVARHEHVLDCRARKRVPVEMIRGQDNQFALHLPILSDDRQGRLGQQKGCGIVGYPGAG